MQDYGMSWVAQMVKESACKTGDLNWIPGLERSPGEGNGNPFQYSCLENPMDRGAWWGIVHGVTKSRTWLSVHAHGALTNRYVGEVESISRAVFISYMDFEANPSIRWAKRFEHTGPGWRGKPDATQACRGCYIRPALSLSNNLFPTYHTLNNASIDLLLETWFLSSAYINRLNTFSNKIKSLKSNQSGWCSYM